MNRKSDYKQYITLLLSHFGTVQITSTSQLAGYLGDREAVRVMEASKVLRKVMDGNYFIINPMNYGMISVKEEIKLDEYTVPEWMSDGLSDLNKKWYDDRKKNGNNKVEYITSVYNAKDGTLTVRYHVTPTYTGKKNPSKPYDKPKKTVKIINQKTGEERTGKFYTLMIQFQGIGELIGTKDEWFRLSKKERIEIVRDIIDGSEVKLWSNDMSMKWQGTWKSLDAIDSAIYPFPNLPDENFWNGPEMHNNNDRHLTKHFPPVFSTLKPNADRIANDITLDFEKRRGGLTR
jgi:hypothetical protein